MNRIVQGSRVDILHQEDRPEVVWVLAKNTSRCFSCRADSLSGCSGLHGKLMVSCLGLDIAMRLRVRVGVTLKNIICLLVAERDIVPSQAYYLV
jgi:hypothetical protein